MSVIDSSNAREHSYPDYGRQFKSYKWYKPVIVGILFCAFFILFAGLLSAGMAILVSRDTTPDNIVSVMRTVFASDYDSMDLANAVQSIVSLGNVAVMIPALWLASVIVRDRPFSSYTSSRGGWNGKVFWKAMLIAFVCISVPIAVDELFIKKNISNFHMGFTLASFAVVTILGPLQCIAEEYAFRGLMMQTLGSWFRLPVIAVVLQAVVFMLMHPYNTVGKIGILVSGMVFALTAWIGRGIEISSAYHICNNMALFYLQGLNVATISSESTTRDLIFELVFGAIFVLVIFIVSKKTNWFNEIKKDDLAAWNGRIDAKIARKEAKEAAKAEKEAARNAKTGAHDGGATGKHFKQ